jgi:hypothetical protein
MLPLVVILLLIAIAIISVSAVIIWLIGLIIPVAFFVIATGFLYVLHKMDALDVEENKWLVAFPPVMFGLGFVADHVGVLSVQPLSMVDPVSTPVTFVLLAVIVCLLFAVIVYARRK